MVTEKEFQRMVTLERRRAERSRRPFLLMLLDMGDSIPCEKNGKVLEKLLVVLSRSTRGSDITGWYRNNSVLGVMFTEFEFVDPDTIPSTLARRVADTLRKNLSEEQFDQTCISFHLFPEEWNPRQPDPDAPVYAPLRPKPRLRSGGAMAIPETDDADLSTTTFFQRMLVAKERP
jgi:hypothetical protein